MATTPPGDLVGRLLHTRWLVRAPIWLYRTGLGFLLGHRRLLLEHIGRKSGARRYVVLEVVERPTPDEYVIVSGFGERSQWYRNVIANPNVRVSTGCRRNARARATPLTREMADAALDRYATQHPRAWRRLEPTLRAALQTSRPRPPMFIVELTQEG